tara:strand:- start:7850 stop:7972 length:123 start_codon:yes stop_codon:yes gene_type:complete
MLPLKKTIKFTTAILSNETTNHSIILKKNTLVNQLHDFKH